MARLSHGNFVHPDRWLLDLVDAKGPLPAALLQLGTAGVDFELLPVFEPYSDRAPGGAWRESERVDPRIASDLERLLGNVRILTVKSARERGAPGIDALSADPLIRTAEAIPVREFCGTARRSRRDASWHLDATRFHAARRLPEFRDAADIQIALLDSGLDARHPELRRLAPHAARDPFESNDRPPRDRLGHGTHTAGIILGDRKSKFGLRGMTAARIQSYSIVDPLPRVCRDPERLEHVVDERRYLAAFVRAIESRVDILHLGVASLAGPTFLDRALLELANELNIVVVAPTGNFRDVDDPPTWATRCAGVIAVGACSIDDSLAPFSSRAADMTLAAPGIGIWSSAPTSVGEFGFELVRNAKGRLVRHALARPRRVMSLDGTSPAAAQVSAAVAVLFAAHGKDSPARVRERLASTAWRGKSRRRAGGNPARSELDPIAVLDVANLLAN